MQSNEAVAQKMMNHHNFEAMENAIINEPNKRKVDAMFAELMVGSVEVPKTASDNANYPQFETGLAVPRYSESIDALLPVAHKVLPEIGKIDFEYRATHVTAFIRFVDRRGGYANKATPALALMSAIIHLKLACDTGEWDK